MKNKKIIRKFTVLLAALVIMCGFSVTAYAGGGDESDDTPTPVTEETPAPETEPEETTGGYEPQPLTPEGNMSLVDDITGEASGDKQFITVVTKNGNYFYIIIDRAEDGENTVHFLNQVDDADLSALLEDGETTEETPAVCTCTEKCEAGKVNTSCPVCVTSMTGCTGKEPTPTPTEQPEEPKEKGGNPGVVLALVLFALLGGGAAFYYFKFLKPKQNVKGDTDLEDFEFEDYDEDEPEADTGETPEDEETEEETL